MNHVHAPGSTERGERNGDFPPRLPVDAGAAAATNAPAVLQPAGCDRGTFQGNRQMGIVDTKLSGVIEQTKVLEFGPRAGEMVHGFIRSDSGQRFFLHPSDIERGLSLRRFDRVRFKADRKSDERGPRARQVELLEAHQAAAPTHDAVITCTECRVEFRWTADEQRRSSRRRSGLLHHVSG